MKKLLIFFSCVSLFAQRFPNNWRLSDTTTTNSTLPGIGSVHSLVATNSVSAGSATITTNIAIGTTPVASQPLTAKGTTSDSTAYVAKFLDSASREIMDFNNQGRADFIRYLSDGGIIRLTYAGTPANNMRGGHYAMGAPSGDGNIQSIALMEAVITTTNVASLNSYVRIGYMEDLDVSAGSGQQPNKYLKFDKNAFLCPPSIRIGTNYATTGNISLPNLATIKFMNAATDTDITAMSLSGSDVLVLGGGAGSISLQSAGTTRMSVSSTGLTPSVDGTGQIGASTLRWSKMSANGISSYATDAAVTIDATGWTNTFVKNAVVRFSGTNVTYTVYNNALTALYTNLNNVGVLNATEIVQPSGKVIISGTAVFGRASPF